jgi:hypothetical protein
MSNRREGEGEDLKKGREEKVGERGRNEKASK